MTSPSTKSEDDTRKDNHPYRNKSSMDVPVHLKEGLRQSIIAKRHARGEKQIKIEYTEPQEMELTPAEMEKKERRREQNRRAAQRCRNKKRMSQKSVIQNYEKVVSRNGELLQELNAVKQHRNAVIQKLNAVKQELNELTRTFNYHRLHCPSFAEVKSESFDSVKFETIDEEPVDSRHGDSSYKLQLVLHPEKFRDIAPFLPDMNSTESYLSAQTSNVANILPSEIFASLNEGKRVNVVQSDMDFINQLRPQSPPEDIRDIHPWQYSSSSLHAKNQSISSCNFNEPTKSDNIQQNQHCLSQNHTEEQAQLNTENPDINCAHNYAQQYQSLVATQTCTIPPIRHTNAHMCLSQYQVLLSQNSPCQVVPSLRSPTPILTTPRTSCSRDVTRHRSLSGGSISASEAATPCGNEKRFSSVSSEGSMYVDNPSSVYQDLRTVDVYDAETDDVFINTSGGRDAPLEGLDANNNMEAVPNNNSVTENEVLQYLIAATDLLTPDLHGSRGDVVMSDSDTLAGAEDVSSLMQISSEDIQFLNAMDNNDQSTDIILKFLLSETQRADY